MITISCPKQDEVSGNVVETVISTTILSEENLTSFASWLNDQGATAGTIDKYLRSIRHYTSQLNGTEPTYQTFASYSGAKRILGYALRKFQTWRKEVCNDSVCLGVPSKLPAASRPHPTPMTQAELLKMLRTARIELSLELSKTTRAWLILSWEWGTRIGESEIPWSCFDLSEQEVEVSGKTGERWLPISARGAKILAFLRKNRPDSSAPWIGKRGRSISSGYIYKLFKRVAQRAGLAHLHPHLLRHSAITAWAENDTPMPYLMQLSGHKSVSGVLFYVKPSKQKLREYFQRR